MGEVYHVVYSGAEDPPTQDEIDLWISNYGLYNNTLLPDGNADEVLAALEQRECAFIVETGCMQIQWKRCGSQGAEDGLEQLDVALAP